MGNGDRSGSGCRSNWPARLAWVGLGAGAAVAFLLLRDGGFWERVIVIGAGAILGRLVGELLFRRRPD